MRFRELVVFMTLVSLAHLSGEAKAETFDQSIGPNEIGAVSIAMNDNAVDACWTNLREVREYAEEKLRIQGYDLSGDEKAMLNYTLMIDVTGYRSKTARFCAGAIIVMLAKVSSAEDIFGLHVINMEHVVATTSPNGNLNNEVIEIVQKAIDGM